MLFCCMKTLKDLFIEYHRQLDNIYSVPEAEAITLLVISEISGFSKAKVKAFPDADMSPEVSSRLIQILHELGKGKPVQYILGYTDFYGSRFNVNDQVLIPRPETEELVDWVKTSVRESGLEAGNILDAGTGSGCIAISLKKYLSGFDVSGVDISTQALATAKENAELNQVVVNFIETDILDPAAYHLMPKCDIIVSNPPYVTQTDKTKMHRNVIDFEPHIALFVPENDPLIFYKAITAFARENLTENGMLFFEINESYGYDVVKLLEKEGFRDVELRKDLPGRDRMVKAVR